VEGGGWIKTPTFPHTGNVSGEVPEDRGWRLTIKICTFIDMENMHVIFGKQPTETEEAWRAEKGRI
jgi:hypothetical protein